MANYRRKRIRLEGFDYSLPGVYFVTISTAQYACILSSIEQSHANLSAIGTVVDQNVLELPIRYSRVEIHSYVIMPNHVHLLMYLHATTDPRANLSLCQIIGAMKGRATYQCREGGLLEVEQQLWQRSFHERIVRNENEFQQFNDYISANPARWHEDDLFG
jgi:putative transposase